MKYLVASLALLATVVGGSFPNTIHQRQARGTVGSYSGVVNGQHYGGIYNAPDDGPAVFNRFGDIPDGAPGTPGGFGGPGGPGVFPGPAGFAGPVGPGAFPGAAGFAGAGAGAFGSSFAGPVTYAPQFPFVNLPPFQNPVDFSSFFQSYFKQLNQNLAQSFKLSMPHSSSSASSSINFGDDDNGAFSKNFAYQQAAFDAAQNAFQATANNRFGPGGSYAPGSSYGGAAASASFGPGGGHQTASVFPKNPAKPNVNTRFDAPGPKPGGSFGVSTSSFSGSSNVGGQKTSYKEASTTINDNGKVSTYTVRS